MKVQNDSHRKFIVKLHTVFDECAYSLVAQMKQFDDC
jgi:hypothetical protein